VLKADLSALGQGTITVRVSSRNHPDLVRTATATVTAGVVATTTRLLVTPSPVRAGAPVQLTAIVQGADGSVPEGVVTFAIDGEPLPPVPLTTINGVAQAVLTIPAPAVGTHTITATYAGSGGFVASASGSVPLVVAAEEVVAPRVVSFARFGYHRQPTRLVVSYRGGVDPAAATDLANYRLIARGPDGRFGTADDRTVRVKQVVYDPATRSVILSPSQRLPLGRRYRLIVDGVVGPDRTILDGDGDGRPGGAFVAKVNRQALAGSLSDLRRGQVARLFSAVAEGPGSTLDRAVSPRRLQALAQRRRGR
jgi:hypothetical protein